MQIWAALLGIVALQPQAAIRYLALGDSYTIGESVAPNDRWPVKLTAALHTAGVAIAPPRIVARTGWTTDELDQAMDRANLARCYDLVSLSIGVNNQYRGRSLTNYREEYAALLERAIGLAGGQPGRVFVLSIPDWAVTPFGQNSGRDVALQSAQIAAYNGAMRQITQARGVAYFDITPSTLLAASDASLIAADGLHPSASLYRLWVTEILAGVVRLLNDAEVGPC